MKNKAITVVEEIEWENPYSGSFISVKPVKIGNFIIERAVNATKIPLKVGDTVVIQRAQDKALIVKVLFITLQEIEKRRGEMKEIEKEMVEEIKKGVKEEMKVLSRLKEKFKRFLTRFLGRFRKVKPLPEEKVYQESFWEEHKELWIGLISFIILFLVSWFWSDYQSYKERESLREGICGDYCNEKLGGYGNFISYDICVEECIKDRVIK